MSVLESNGIIKKGVVGFTGNRRLVAVVDTDAYGVRLVSLPHQPFTVGGADFYAPLIDGQKPYRVAPSVWLEPVHLDKLHPKNIEVLQRLGVEPLGAVELGYTPPTEEAFEPVILERPTIDTPLETRDEGEPIKKRAASAGGKKPKVQGDTVLSVTGKPPVIPELRREAQFTTFHRILSKGPMTEDALLDAALQTDTFKGYDSRKTMHWQVYQLVLHGIFKVGA